MNHESTTSTITQLMPSPAAAVFDLIHDYPRRLEWDTLLSEARLTRGHRVPGKGATSICVGKGLLRIIGIETEYLVFQPGTLAAVKMINRPPFLTVFRQASVMRIWPRVRWSRISSISPRNRRGCDGCCIP